jgi:hypothetical protein
MIRYRQWGNNNPWGILFPLFIMALTGNSFQCSNRPLLLQELFISGIHFAQSTNTEIGGPTLPKQKGRNRVNKKAEGQEKTGRFQKFASSRQGKRLLSRPI